MAREAEFAMLVAGFGFGRGLLEVEDSWKKIVHPTAEVIRTVEGALDVVSSDPADAIPDADVILLCMPVHQYRNTLNRLAP